MPQIDIVQTSNVDLVVDCWRLFAVQLVKIWGPLLLGAIFTGEVRQGSFWLSFLLPPTEDYSSPLSILTRKRTKPTGPRSDLVLFPPSLSFIWGKTQAYELGTRSSIGFLPSLICPHGCMTLSGHTPLYNVLSCVRKHCHLFLLTSMPLAPLASHPLAFLSGKITGFLYDSDWILLIRASCPESSTAQIPWFVYLSFNCAL